MVQPVCPLVKMLSPRFAANGWQCITTDGHNPAAVEAALVQADAEVNCPSLIACRTTIGFGAPSKAGTAASHGAPLGAEEVAGRAHGN